MLNNVETFCAVPAILRDGGAAFAALGIPKAGGTKMTCLTGHVNKPGVYELKLGFPVKQMIEEVGGGMRNGKKLKAFIPGGSSCPVLTAAEVEGATMDYDSMAQRKSMLGSGGVIIMDEDTCMVKAALRIMRFYAHESCGWCIPCREGTTWLKKILQRFHEGAGHAQRHQPDRRSGEEYAGPHLLPAGRRRGHADHLDRGEVPAGIRRSSERQAVPLRKQARWSLRRWAGPRSAMQSKCSGCACHPTQRF